MEEALEGVEAGMERVKERLERVEERLERVEEEMEIMEQRLGERAMKGLDGGKGKEVWLVSAGRRDEGKIKNWRERKELEEEGVAGRMKKLKRGTETK